MRLRSCLGSEACSLLLLSAPFVITPPCSAWGKEVLGGHSESAADKGAPCLRTISELVARETSVGLATAVAAVSLTARGDQIQYLMPYSIVKQAMHMPFAISP